MRSCRRHQMLAQAHGYPGISPVGRSPVVVHLNASDGPAPPYGPSPAASSKTGSTRICPPQILADSEYGAARLDEAASGVTVIRDVGGRSPVHPWIRALCGGRASPPLTDSLPRRRRYFPRMHSPVAPDELVAAIEAEVAAGAAWVKIIGDAPEWGTDGPVPDSAAATYDLAAPGGRRSPFCGGQGRGARQPRGLRLAADRRGFDRARDRTLNHRK
jgi:hypothetical protein